MRAMVIVIGLLLLSSCSTVQGRMVAARHPEIEGLHAQIRILDEKQDMLLAKLQSLLERMNAVEEAHRDDTERVVAYVRTWVDELKAEIAKRQP
jgi:hypothetical protein